MMMSNYEKANYHLHAAEVAQAKVEAWEEEATRKARDQQTGRMSRDDNTEIDYTYIQKILLEKHGYKRQCGIRDAHQKQAQMYAAAVAANLPPTGNALTDGKILLPRAR